MLKNMQETLEMAFDVLNRVYFNNELPTIVISIMSSPKSNGHFTLGKVWRAEDSHYNEINISAEHLDRPIENICATLCHEMVHYYCLLNGIADVSQGGRYHNKFFKQEAEKRGLNISYAKYIGYSVTEPSKEFTEVLKSNNIESLKMLWRDEFNHEWYATICSRTIRKGNYYTSQKVSDINSLSTWCLNNPVQGQIIKNDWTGKGIDGKHYTIPCNFVIVLIIVTFRAVNEKYKNCRIFIR